MRKKFVETRSMIWCYFWFLVTSVPWPWWPLEAARPLSSLSTDVNREPSWKGITSILELIAKRCPRQQLDFRTTKKPLRATRSKMLCWTSKLNMVRRKTDQKRCRKTLEHCTMMVKKNILNPLGGSYQVLWPEFSIFASSLEFEPGPEKNAECTALLWHHFVRKHTFWMMSGNSKYWFLTRKNLILNSSFLAVILSFSFSTTTLKVKCDFCKWCIWWRRRNGNRQYVSSRKSEL